LFLLTSAPPNDNGQHPAGVSWMFTEWRIAWDGLAIREMQWESKTRSGWKRPSLHWFTEPTAVPFGAFSYVFNFIYYYFLQHWSLNSGLHLEPFHQPFFVMGFFETGSHELFARAGFEPWSSWSLS
jgi:hypothetical protein